MALVRLFDRGIGNYSAPMNQPIPEAPPLPDEALEKPARPVAVAGGKIREIGGPAGPEPTRYGDWERNGRCADF